MKHGTNYSGIIDRRYGRAPADKINWWTVRWNVRITETEFESGTLVTIEHFRILRRTLKWERFYSNGKGVKV